LFFVNSRVLLDEVKNPNLERFQIMRIIKNSILLAVLLTGMSFQLFLPSENSLLVRHVRAADLNDTMWYSSSHDYVLFFGKDGVNLYLESDSSDPITGTYTKKGNSVDMEFYGTVRAQLKNEIKASAKIDGKKMSVKFQVGGKTEVVEFTKEEE